MTDILMLSILAMDVYNRDGNGLALGAQDVGAAQFNGSTSSPDGFLGANYSYDGDTVIA